MSDGIIERGNGEWDLADGIKDGKDGYYKFYGIGGLDENGVDSGKSYGKKEDWNWGRKGILGGGKFVRKEYFENEQICLYEMRWNGEEGGENEYGSDIDWGDNIGKFMKKYYQQFPIKKHKLTKHFYLYSLSNTKH